MYRSPKNNGFTLVELLVSVGITAVLMLGVATFFSSTFRNMFMARDQVTNTQEEFVVNTILGGKFVNVVHLDQLPATPGPNKPWAVLRNDTETGDLPFTYIGTRDNHIVFKDFFVFNGREGSLASSNLPGMNNPGGMTDFSGETFVTAPLEDTIYYCPSTGSPCMDLKFGDLNQPIDITDDDSQILYFTDSGNNRIMKISEPFGMQEVSELVTNTALNYPTGIAFYEAPDGTEYLFVADTYNHVIKKIKIIDGTTEVVVGDGDDEICNPLVTGRQHSAIYCKLNFPTGLLVVDNKLYISDTGNARILAVSDPGLPASEGAFERIPFTFGDSYAVEKVSFSNIEDEIFSGSSMTDSLNASYDPGAHEMTPNVLYQAYDNPGDPCNWDLDGTELYLNITDAQMEDFEDHDFITVEGESYEIQSRTGTGGRLICEDLPDIYRAHQLTVDRALNGVSNGSNIYFASAPQEETIDFEFPSLDCFPKSGFQTIDIDVYEFGNATPVESFQHIVRVGDGELGTPEDLIEVYDDTFTSDNYVTGLGVMGGLPDPSIDAAYDTSAFSDFDYTSDFEVGSFGFTEPVSGTVLELDYEAKVGEDPTQMGPFGNPLPIYEENTLNANIKE